MAKRLPRWDLSILFDESDPNARTKAFESIERIIREIESHKSRLSGNISVRNFLKLVRLYDKYRIQSAKVFQYASMKYDENTLDQGMLEFYNKIARNIVDFDNRLLFFKLWWKNIDSDNFQRLISKMDKDHRHEYRCIYFEDILPEAEEKIISIKDLAGICALSQVYDISTAELDFILKIRGKNKEFTIEEINQCHFSSSNPSIRKASYIEELGKLGRNSQLLSFLHQTIINDYVAEEIQIRGRKKPRLYGDSYNNILDPLITENIFPAIRRNASVFQRYFLLKARALGKKKLTRYDVPAHLPRTKFVKNFSFKEASKLVLDAFYSFSQEFGDAAKAIFDSNHIDARTFKGKMQGAYCQSVVPGIPSWITLQFQNNMESIQALAHELGHGAHFGLSGSHSIGTFEANLLIAEISSTFAETLVFHKMYEQARDPATKRFILGFMLDNVYMTLMRQGYFAIWEYEMSKLAQEDKLTLEAMDKTYLDLCREQFGDAVYIPDEFKKEWLAIPHFFQQPFYVYSYVVNELIKLILFDKYKKEDTSFPPKMIKLLSAGNSAYPLQLFARVGINVNSPRFGQKSFNIINKMIDEYETLLKEH